MIPGLAARVLSAAREAGLRLALAESCTGGLVCAALTEIPGASDVVERGFVTYSNAAKAEMLGVPPLVFVTDGAVSEACARAMAEGALARAHADLAVSITGIAGPGGSEFKPEGRVCFGLARHGAQTLTETVEFGALGRGMVRARACDHALEMLLAALDAR